MSRPRQFARRRPEPPDAQSGHEVHDTQAAATDAGVGSVALLQAHLAAAHAAAASPARDTTRTPGAGDSGGISQDWRSRLGELFNAIGLTGEQEAEFERLARQQQERIRSEIPRLLHELKPHFGTPGEAEAKTRHEAGLRALKAELDAETEQLLSAFGIRADAE